MIVERAKRERHFKCRKWEIAIGPCIYVCTNII